MNGKHFFTRPWSRTLAAVACTFLWGSAVPCVKIGYELFSIAPSDFGGKLVFAGCRFTVAGLVVLAMESLRQKRPALPTRDGWGEVFRLGLVLTALQYLFYYVGLSHTTGTKCSIITSVSTFISALLAHFFVQGDRLSPQKLVGCLVGFAGVVLVNASGGQLGAFNLNGDGAVLLSAVCFAVGQLLNKKVAQHQGGAVATGGHLFTGGVVLAAVGLLAGGRLTIPSWQAACMLLYLIFISSVAFSLWSLLLQYNRVSQVTVYFFLNPVFGVLLSGLMLGEEFLGASGLVALALVCVGIYIVNKGEREHVH